MRRVRSCLTTFAVAFACLGTPTAVWAQLAPGYSGQSSAPTEGVADDYWLLLRGIGPCVAQGKQADAAVFLATEPGSPAETRAFRELFGSQRNKCMQNFVSAVFLRAHLRGALAEGMYELVGAGRAAPASVAAGSEDHDAPIADLRDFGRCYVAMHPAKAHALLVDTRLASDAEKAAVRAMASDFGGCLPADREVKLNPAEVRMALAEALYHRAVRSSASEGTDAEIAGAAQ